MTSVAFSKDTFTVFSRIVFGIATSPDLENVKQIRKDGMEEVRVSSYDAPRRRKGEEYETHKVSNGSNA